MKFAERTTVPPEKTRAEIETTLKRYGATGFAFSIEKDRAIVMFKMNNRTLRFNLTIPAPDIYAKAKSERNLRQLWRGLFLAIKGKLVSVESNVELFEEVFLANIVMPDGKTVGEHVVPKIGQAYLESGGMPQLLLGGGN